MRLSPGTLRDPKKKKKYARVGATVSIRHDFQPPGLLIQTSQRRVIQTPLMMCFLVHSHLESTQNGMQTGRPAVHRSRNIIIRRPSTITGLDWTGGLTLKIIFMLLMKFTRLLGCTMHHINPKTAFFLHRTDLMAKLLKIFDDNK